MPVYTATARVPWRAMGAWAGSISAPIALLDDDPPQDGWAEILAMAERLEPTPALTPTDPALRDEMLALSHAVMGEGGLLWSARLVAIEDGLCTGGQRGFPVPVAQYLGKKYGYQAGCSEAARQRIAEVLSQLEARLGAQSHMLGALSALDVYVTAAVDALVLLDDAQCPMTAENRAMFTAMGASAAVPASLVALRDRMHADHIPLPLKL